MNVASHPAAAWALETGFTPEQVDCTIAVVLKILDNKCKMLPGEKAAVMAIYDVVRTVSTPLLADAHAVIEAARQESAPGVAEDIHRLRVHAESVIPKPVMKGYKAFLRDGLFG